MSVPRHISVLSSEVLHFLDPQPGQVLVDATVGAGGHCQLLAQRILPGGRLIGLDLDAAMLDLARPRLEGLPVTLMHGGFDGLRGILDELGIPAVDAVLADLGFCTDQMDNGMRGFSFNQDGPLDMRLDTSHGPTAYDLLVRTDERDLADLIYQFGEERFSRRIARRLVEARRLGHLPQTTGELADLVRRCIPRPKGKRPSIDPATRTFQALRIAVNEELVALEILLQHLPRCLNPGGKAALISFHSLEDRRVKQTFRDREVWEEVIRKPVVAGDAELATNPRARSAKLRVARLRGKERHEG